VNCFKHITNASEIASLKDDVNELINVRDIKNVKPFKDRQAALRDIYIEVANNRISELKLELADLEKDIIDVYDNSPVIKNNKLSSTQDTQKTEVVKNAESKLNNGQAKNKSSVHEHDSLLVAIAKLGGLSSIEAKSQGVDPASFGLRGHGIARVFNNGKRAKTYDEMSELLRGYGYDIPTANDLVDKVSMAINQGDKIYTNIGYENAAKIEQEEQISREMADHVQRVEVLLESAKRLDNEFGTKWHDELLKINDFTVESLSTWERDLNDEREYRYQESNRNSQAQAPGETGSGETEGELKQYTEKELQSRDNAEKLKQKADTKKTEREDKLDKDKIKKLDNVIAKKSRQSSTTVKNPHTESTLLASMQKVMDAKYGKGWTTRLLDTGKVKIINIANAYLDFPGLKFSVAWWQGDMSRNAEEAKDFLNAFDYSLLINKPDIQQISKDLPNYESIIDTVENNKPLESDILSFDIIKNEKKNTDLNRLLDSDEDIYLHYHDNTEIFNIDEFKIENVELIEDVIKIVQKEDKFYVSKNSNFNSFGPNGAISSGIYLLDSKQEAEQVKRLAIENQPFSFNSADLVAYYKGQRLAKLSFDSYGNLRKAFADITGSKEFAENLIPRGVIGSDPSTHPKHLKLKELGKDGMVLNYSVSAEKKIGNAISKEVPIDRSDNILDIIKNNKGFIRFSNKQGDLVVKTIYDDKTGKFYGEEGVTERLNSKLVEADKIEEKIIKYEEAEQYYSKAKQIKSDVSNAESVITSNQRIVDSVQEGIKNAINLIDEGSDRYNFILFELQQVQSALNNINKSIANGDKITAVYRAASKIVRNAEANEEVWLYLKNEGTKLDIEKRRLLQSRFEAYDKGNNNYRNTLSEALQEVFAPLVKKQIASEKRAAFSKASVIAKFWHNATLENEAFQFGEVTENKSLSKIIKAINTTDYDINYEYSDDNIKLTIDGEDGYFVINDADTDTPYISSINAPNVPGKDLGSLLYQVAFSWAHNNNKTIVGDHGGLTRINVLRRSFQMLSSALRYGSIKHVYPSDLQVSSGLSWGRSDLENISNLASFISDKVLETNEELSSIVYNLEDGNFYKDGTEVNDKEIVRIARDSQASRNSGIGLATAKVALVTRALREAQSGMLRQADGSMVEGALSKPAQRLSAKLVAKKHSPILKSKNGRVQAFHNPQNNITYLIPENISKDDDIYGLLLHEIGVHALNMNRDEKEFKSILEQIENMRNIGHKDVVSAFNRVPKDTKPEHITEEVLAYLVQDNANLSITKRFIAWFKKQLRKFGVGLDWVNKLDTYDFVLMSDAALRYAHDSFSKDNTPDNNDIRFSVSPTPDSSPSSVGNGNNNIPPNNNENNIDANPERNNHDSQGVVGKVNRWIDSFGPLGDLPEKNKYLAMRYRTLGNLAKVEEISKSVYNVFSRASKEDAEAIYRYLTTKDASTDEINNLFMRGSAKNVKSAIMQIGQQLVDRGFLDPETHAKYEGMYLPRVYLKHILGDGLFSALGSGKTPSDLGYLKERKDIPEEVRRLILMEIKDPAYLTGRAISVPMRDIAIIDWFGQIADNNQWVWEQSHVTIALDDKNAPEYIVMPDGNGVSLNNTKADYIATKVDKRFKTPTYNPVKLKPGQSKQRVTPYFLSKEAERIREQAHAAPEDDRADILALADVYEQVANKAIQNIEGAIPKDFTQMPKSKRYGALAGLVVRKEIYDDIVGTITLFQGEPSVAQKILGDGGALARYTSFWKFMKVAANPPSHVRNIMSNLVLLHLSGVSFHQVPQRIFQAIKEIRYGGKHWDIAKKYGVTQSSFANTELFKMNRELNDLIVRNQDSEKWEKLKAVIAYNAGKAVDAAGELYQFMEGVSKVAKIIDAMEKGATEEQASIEAHESLFDYSLVSPNVRYLRNAALGTPFATFYVKALPQLVKVALTHPERFLPYIMIFAALSTLVAAQDDVDLDDLEKLKKALPEWLQEKGHAYILPVKDEHGRWQVIDLGYFVPWTMYYELGNEAARGDIGGVMKSLGVLGSPVADLITAIKTGIDPFTRRPIVDKFGTPAQQVGDIFNYLWRMNMPTFITDIGAAGKVIEAFNGDVDKQGQPKSTMTQAMLRFAGINVYGIDPEYQRSKNIMRRENEMKEAKMDLYRELRDPNATPEQLKKVSEHYRKILIDMSDDLNKYIKESEVHPNLRIKK
jgi:hypothetical protein